MYLGIDLGTSEVKVLLLDDHHSIVATTGERLEVSRPHAHWSEQDPGAWWLATCKAVATMKDEAPKAYAAVKAIGLSGQMHGATLLDNEDQVLRPAILWNDTRSAAECVELTERFPALPQVSGNLAMPGFTAPKLVWVAKHEPAIFKKIKSVLLPKDFLRLKLIGEKVGEMSDAAGTLWLDVAERDWSDDLLAATGLSRSHMPRLVEGCDVSGMLLPALAAEWGLPDNVVVAGGGGDNAASAVGIGAVAPGDGFLSLGTSGVLFVVTDQFRPNSASAVHAFCHALPNTWHQMSVMLSAASCLSWMSKLVGVSSEGQLLAQVAKLTAVQKGAAPVFLPYLSGERTPHNDATAQGLFFGLAHDTDAAALAYSVIEGVAFGTMDGLAALQAAGTEIGRLLLVGGGSRSPVWAQLIASILNIEVVTLAGGETGGALGAARLAWLAAGGDVASVCVTPEIRSCFKPDMQQREQLLPRYDRFRTLYPRVRDLFPH